MTTAQPWHETFRQALERELTQAKANERRRCAAAIREVLSTHGSNNVDAALSRLLEEWEVSDGE